MIITIDKLQPNSYISIPGSVFSEDNPVFVSSISKSSGGIMLRDGDGNTIKKIFPPKTRISLLSGNFSTIPDSSKKLTSPVATEKRSVSISGDLAKKNNIIASTTGNSPWHTHSEPSASDTDPEMRELIKNESSTGGKKVDPSYNLKLDKNNRMEQYKNLGISPSMRLDNNLDINSVDPSGIDSTESILNNKQRDRFRNPKAKLESFTPSGNELAGTGYNSDNPHYERSDAPGILGKAARGLQKANRALQSMPVLG